MRTILAILAALAIAATAHAETEALVTDTNNNVISGRTGALVFSNPIGSGQLQISNNTLVGVDEPTTGITVDSEFLELNATASINANSPIAFGGFEATTRTNLGLGATNTPTFANLTLTTLTNATGPNLVLADTNGQLSTGSVPSGAAPLGAVQTADGAGGSSFVASEWIIAPSADFSITNQTTPLAVTGFTFPVSANTTYEVVFSGVITNTVNGGHNVDLVLPSLITNSLGAGGYGWRQAAGDGNVRAVVPTGSTLRISSVATTGANEAVQAGMVVFQTGTTGGTAEIRLGQQTSSGVTTMTTNTRIRVKQY
jgi:hypothetical protein